MRVTEKTCSAVEAEHVRAVMRLRLLNAIAEILFEHIDFIVLLKPRHRLLGC